MSSADQLMRSDASFHRILYSQIRGAFSPRLGKFTLKKTSGNEIHIDTPGLITSTSRGTVPHLTRDHVENTGAIKWVHVPFETFLERSPPIPTLLGGEKALQNLLGFSDGRHLISMSLRDPFDGRQMPPNGNKFVNANCIRGVRKITPEQYLSFVLACDPDLVVGLSDIPFTPPPFSQKRITKSLERSSAWLTSLLQLSPGNSPDKPHQLNIFTHLVGDISEQARRAFAYSLKETLYGKDAEQVKPYKCLDDSIFGYVFDLIPLRTSLLAPTTVVSEEAEEVDSAPHRRVLNTRSLTQPQTETVLPDVVGLLQASLDSLPPKKPRIATGASSPHGVLQLIRDVGIDIFDVVWAQKAADWGIALDFVFPAPDGEHAKGGSVREDGRRDLGHNLYSPQYAADFTRFASSFAEGASQSAEPICPCIACSPTSPLQQLIHASVDALMGSPAPGAGDPVLACDPPFTRAYVHHLLHTHEMSAHALLAAHNLAVVDAFFASVRNELARGAPHSHHPRSHPHGVHSDSHPESETYAIPSSDGVFERFAEEVERFCSVYDGALRVFGEAKRDWIAVDYARGKGRLAREKAKQEEGVLATKPEIEAEVDEAAIN
ncbi:hypothetical protein M0805_008037 [Coniferiporia weirii]|nr:hypothetical protein M0805_008037 [Coniferiporia weirii]